MLLDPGCSGPLCGSWDEGSAGDSRAIALQPVHLCLTPDKAKHVPPPSQCPQSTDFCSQKGRLLRCVGPLELPIAAGACHFLGWQTSRECSHWQQCPNAHLPCALHPQVSQRVSPSMWAASQLPGAAAGMTGGKNTQQIALLHIFKRPLI